MGMFTKELCWKCYGVDRFARRVVPRAVESLKRAGRLRLTPSGRWVLVPAAPTPKVDA